jgi:linoleate 10R-lipoxygenase
MDELIGNILGVAVGSSVNYAQASVHVIDFYLDDAREKERKHIVQLCSSQDAQSAELLVGYVREGMRMFIPSDSYLGNFLVICNRSQVPGPWFIS